MTTRVPAWVALWATAALIIAPMSLMAAKLTCDRPFLVFSYPVSNDARLQLEQRVEQVVAQHLDELRRCYLSRLVAKPNLQGKVFLKFDIAPSGPIELPTSWRSPLGDAQVEQCMANAAGSWTLPKPTNPIGIYPRVTIIYPFTLQSAGDGAPTPPADAAVGAAPEHVGLDKNLIRAIIGLHVGQLRTCYERELSGNTNLQGRVLVQFKIALSGQVTESIVDSSTLGNPSVEQCVADAVRKWEFPKPHDRPVVVTYPFMFRSVSDPPASPSVPTPSLLSTPPMPKNAPRVIPAFLMKKEQLSGAEPHLPDAVKKARCGSAISSSYKLCIAQDGTVDSVQVLAGIPEADDGVISTLRQWKYKPRDMPVCFVQLFEHHLADCPPRSPSTESIPSVPLFQPR